VLVYIEVLPGEFIGRHTHPGLEMTVLLEGEATLMVDGRPDQPMKPGDWFQVPAEVPHSVQNGDKLTRAMATYIVEKDKPIVSFV
jgi:quercetin dioxygenase-like cupin family protein